MNKKPINPSFYLGKPPIVPNAAPVVPGAPRDLGENARLKVLEDRLVPKNTDKIAEEVDWETIKSSDSFMYLSDAKSNLQKILAKELLRQGPRGLMYTDIADLIDEPEYVGDITHKTLELDAISFNRPNRQEDIAPYIDEKFIFFALNKVMTNNVETVAIWLAIGVIKSEAHEGKITCYVDKADDLTSRITDDLMAKVEARLNEFIEYVDQKIDADIAIVKSDILATVDDTVNAAVAVETGRAEAIEESLRTDVNTNTAAIEAEVNTNRNQAIQRAITAEAQARNTAITNAIADEAQARNTAITNAIADEAQARNTADSALDKRVGDIEAVIPDDATSNNKLTTEDYVDKNGGKIDVFKVNHVEQEIIDKTVDIFMPTRTSQLENNGDGTDSNSPFATEAYVEENGGKIDIIKVNNAEQQIDPQDKSVNISVPTAVSQLTNDANYATETYVNTAISNLPEPMVFKGTLGENATISELPEATGANEGWTYKVITDGTYAGQVAKIGDVFVSAKIAEDPIAYNWIIIPAGDELNDTWRGININGNPFKGDEISSGYVNYVEGGHITITGQGNNIAFNVENGYAIPSNEQINEINANIGANTTAIESHIAKENNPHNVTKDQVGLSYVDNKSEATIKSDFTGEIASGNENFVLGKDVYAHTSATNNPHNVTKDQVGLGSVDNTSDANKPVSTAQRAAINAVQDTLDAHTARVDNPHKVTKAQVDLGNVTNDRQIPGLSTGTTEDHIVVFGANGYTVKDGGETIQGIKGYTDTKVQTEIAKLDVNEIGNDGYYINKISEVDGKILATTQEFDKSITSSSTDINVPTSKATYTYVATEIAGAKAYTDNKIRTNAFTLCETDAQVLALCTDEHIGEYIKFVGISAAYNYGSFYIIERTGRAESGNDWDHVNRAFEADRENLQSTTTGTTTLTGDVLGQGRIDIKQTQSITDKLTYHNPGLTPTNNPRYSYDSSQSSDGYEVDWHGGDNYGAQANIKVLDVASDTDTDIILTSRSWWSIFYTEQRNLTFHYTSNGKTGIMLGLANNRLSYAQPNSRATIDNLTNNVRNSHHLKIDADALSAKIRMSIELDEGVFVRNLSNPETANLVVASVWYRYKDLNGILTTPAKIYELSMSMSDSVVKSAPSNGKIAKSSTPEEGVIITGTNGQQAEFNLPLSFVQIGDDHKKDFEIFEVLEVYKSQVATNSQSNCIYLYGLAAFTDLQVLTDTAAIVAGEQYAARNKALGDISIGTAPDGVTMVIEKYNLKGELIGEPLTGLQKALTTTDVVDGDISTTIGFDENGNLKKAPATTIAGNYGPIMLGNGLALDENLELDVVNKVPTPEANKVLRTDNNGTIVWLDPPQTGVTSIDGKTGAITLDSGLDIDNNNQLYIINKVPTPAANKVLRTDANNNIVWLDPPQTGVTSLGTKTGDITLGEGLAINSNNELSAEVRLNFIDLL